MNGKRPERGTSRDGCACPACGKESTRVRYDLDTHRILRCRSCTLMWLHPMPSQAELHRTYGEDYFRNREFFGGDGNIYGYFDNYSEGPTKERDSYRVIDRVAELLGPPGIGGRKLLDIGCGLGHMLSAARRRGMRVRGIDRNPTAVDHVRSQLGAAASRGDIMDYEGGTHCAVTMMDVIEHLTDPFAALAKARSLTSPGGVFAVSTMDSDSLVSRLLGKRLEDFRRVREHLFFFNRATIRAALEHAGFEVVRIDSHGVTIPLGILASRGRLALPRAGAALEWIVAGLRLSDRTLYFDPRTKMIAYARRPASSG